MAATLFFEHNSKQMIQTRTGGETVKLFEYAHMLCKGAVSVFFLSISMFPHFFSARPKQMQHRILQIMFSGPLGPLSVI